MRIWLIGAGPRGTEMLRQLMKNPNIEVIVSDPTARPQAVQEGVIARVDHTEVVTPVNINPLARRIRPDLIFIDPGTEQRALGRVSGGAAFADALNTEIATASEFPCIVL